jgi:hypothetical protein
MIERRRLSAEVDLGPEVPATDPRRVYRAAGCRVRASMRDSAFRQQASILVTSAAGFGRHRASLRGAVNSRSPTCRWLVDAERPNDDVTFTPNLAPRCGNERGRR